MANKKLLIIYYSVDGSTKEMAYDIGEGAHKWGVDVEVKAVEECRLNELLAADGIVIGSPTYFSNVAWQVKKLIDESIDLYNRGKPLRNKVGGCFTSAGTRRDAKECVAMMELAFGFHHKMNMAPGIVRANGDEEKTVKEMCHKYGEDIAKQMIA